MVHSEHNVHTPAELESLTNGALHQQAEAITDAAAFVKLAGFDHENTEKVFAAIRGLSKPEAKKQKHALRIVNSLLAEAGVEVVTVPASEAPVLPTEKVSEPAASEAAVPTAKTAKKAVARKRPAKKAAAPKGPNKCQITRAQEQAGEALQVLIDEGYHDNGLNAKRTEVFLDQLLSKGVNLSATAADISHQTLRGLAKIYGGATKVDSETVAINSSVTWGYLANIEMSDLLMWRSNKDGGAKPADIHNSRQSFVNGVARGWKEMIDRGEDPITFLRAIEAAEQLDATDDEIEAEVPRSEDTPEEHSVHVPEAALDAEVVPVGTTEILRPEPELVEPAVESRPLEEEPPHVRLAHRYVTELELDVNAAALREFLNPKAQGDLTEAKKKAVNAVRDLIRSSSEGDRLLETLDVDPRGITALHRLFAVPFKAGGPDDRDPEPLQLHIFRMTDHADRQSYVASTYAALEALLDRLSGTEEPQKEPVASLSQADGEGPMQVVFSNGGSVVARS